MDLGMDDEQLAVIHVRRVKLEIILVLVVSSGSL